MARRSTRPDPASCSPVCDCLRTPIHAQPSLIEAANAAVPVRLWKAHSSTCGVTLGQGLLDDRLRPGVGGVLHGGAEHVRVAARLLHQRAPIQRIALRTLDGLICTSWVAQGWRYHVLDVAPGG